MGQLPRAVPAVPGETVSLRSPVAPAAEQRVQQVEVDDSAAHGPGKNPCQLGNVLLKGLRRGTVRTWHDVERDAVGLEVGDDGPGVPRDLQGRG